MENAKKQNFLKNPEYQVLQQWYDYTEKYLDISLDLIGKLFLNNIGKEYSLVLN